MGKSKIKKDDMVYVIAGEDKGHSGKVLRVIPSENRAIVEGINIVKKHTKPNAKNTQGGIIEQEASIHISNLKLADASGKPIKKGEAKNNEKAAVETKKKSTRSKKTKEEAK